MIHKGAIQHDRGLKERRMQHISAASEPILKQLVFYNSGFGITFKRDSGTAASVAGVSLHVRGTTAPTPTCALCVSHCYDCGSVTMRLC